MRTPKQEFLNTFHAATTNEPKLHNGRSYRWRGKNGDVSLVFNEDAYGILHKPKDDALYLNSIKSHKAGAALPCLNWIFQLADQKGVTIYTFPVMQSGSNRQQKLFEKIAERNGFTPVPDNDEDGIPLDGRGIMRPPQPFTQQTP